jgi:hypothetical protein
MEEPEVEEMLVQLLSPGIILIDWWDTIAKIGCWINEHPTVKAERRANACSRAASSR